MIIKSLKSFSYAESGWRVEKFEGLQMTNLFVGRNAVGKTKTISALSHVIEYILQIPAIRIPDSFSAALSFETESGRTIDYSFEISYKKVKQEKLIVDGDIKVLRDAEKATINQIAILPPADKLIIHVRRDVAEYPYIESIIDWSKYVDILPFCEIEQKTFWGPNDDRIDSIRQFEKLLFSLSKEGQVRFLKNAQSLGFDISNFEFLELNSDTRLVCFKEKGISNSVFAYHLSRGMLRAFYLLIFIESLREGNKPSLFLIDDLCEGLDYRRSIELGKILFEFCDSAGVQLMASSNDAFIMDVVDIEKWQVLRRNGQVVSCINKTNHPDLFEAFTYTGLNNFDFFSSNFIDQHLFNEDTK